MAAARSGRARARRVRRGAPERRRCRSAYATRSTRPGKLSRVRPMTAADDGRAARAPCTSRAAPAACCRSTRTSWSRASRAGSASRTARRTGSPGSRSRRRAAGSRRCARSSSTARPIDATFIGVDGDVRAVPRLRGRVPVVGAVRPPDGRDTRASLADAPRRTASCRSAASPSGSATRSCCRATGCCSRSRGSRWLGQRLRLVPAPVRPPAAVARDRCARRCTADGAPRRVPVHRLRDGRVAARRAPRRAHGHARRRARGPRLPGPGGDCCGALHVARRARSPRRAGSRAA